jgi:pimeloyl-ACP methyl ester carboxylesterase
MKMTGYTAVMLSLASAAHAQQAEGLRSGYATVNGVNMYYQIHGTGAPLVLLHGAFSNLETDFGKLLPALAKTRRVIGIELQGHGHTADIDRPLTFEQMADDTDLLLRRLGIAQADFFGYSMGGGVAVQIAVRHPGLVRKLVYAGGASFAPDGYYPELLAGEKNLTPEALAGTPWHKAYARIAPKPEHWPALVAKVKDLDLKWTGWPAADIQAIKSPALLIIGDADIVRPEHAVQMFRLLGGGVAGDLHGLPRSQLAVLPGTTHLTLVHRAEWLLSMVTAFLDAPVPQAR